MPFLKHNDPAAHASDGNKNSHKCMWVRLTNAELNKQLRACTGAFADVSVRESQRERLAVREARKEASEAADKLRIAKEEKQIALHNRNNDKKRAKAAEKELKKMQSEDLSGCNVSIKRLKFQSDTFYTHVDKGCNWFRRFHILDVPLLVVAIMRKLGREKKTDLCMATVMSDGMKQARDALLRKHEEEIAEHLRTKVYTADHFSLLRLVGGMSKRLCGLIEQSLKYVHHDDGTRTRQKLHLLTLAGTAGPC